MSENSNTYSNTVSSLVDEYMMLSENTEDSKRVTFLLRGKYIWKDIRNNVLKTPSSQWIGVDKTKIPYRAICGNCCDLLMTVLVFNDCKELVPLSINENMNIFDYVKLDKVCQCNDEIKSCLQSSEETTTETITIASTPYIKTTTKTIYENGDVFINVVGPIPNYDKLGQIESVSIGVITNELICNLDLKECGCIDITEENLTKIKDCFCEKVYNSCADVCNKHFNQPKNVPFLNNTGYYREHNKVIYLQGNIPDQILIIYKSNGEAEHDEIIPDFASMTFFQGMDHINAVYSSTMNRFEKESARKSYIASKEELESNLPRNMILTSEWEKSNKIRLRKW